MLESLILGILLKNGMTGYQIKKYITEKFSIFYKTSYGSLYPALKRLDTKGYTKKYSKNDDKRNQCYYKITDKGENHFYEWLVTPVDIFDGPNSHLTKVYFYDNLPNEISQRRLLEYELNNINYLDKLNKLKVKLNTKENENNYYYMLSTLYYGICITQKTIEWCKHIKEKKPLNQLLELKGV